MQKPPKFIATAWLKHSCWNTFKRVATWLNAVKRRTNETLNWYQRYIRKIMGWKLTRHSFSCVAVGNLYGSRTLLVWQIVLVSHKCDTTCIQSGIPTSFERISTPYWNWTTPKFLFSFFQFLPTPWTYPLFTGSVGLKWRMVTHYCIQGGDVDYISKANCQ